MSRHFDGLGGFIEKRFKGGSAPAQSGSTQSSNSEPWGEQKPYLTAGFERAKQQLNSANPTFFPGNTVTPFSSKTQQYLDATSNRATSGSPLNRAAQDQTLKTAQGAYTDPSTNPFYNDMVDSSIREVRPGVDSAFAGGNRLGSPAHAGTMGREMGLAMAPWKSDMYNRERNNQENATSRLPGLAQNDYFDMDKLRQAGSLEEAKAGEGIADEVNRWNFDQNKEPAKLAEYMSMIGGNYGGTANSTTTSTQPMYGGGMFGK